MTLSTGAPNPLIVAIRGMDIHIRILVIVLAIVFIALATTNPRLFLSANNFQSMAIQISEIGLLTLGMSITMLIAGIDLSITATANLSAILAGIAMQAMVETGASGPVSTLVGVVVGIITGSLLGLLNGILIAYGRVTPILATMATLMLYGGIGAVLTGGVSIYGFPEEILSVGVSSIAFIPFPLILLIVCAAVLWLVLNRTPFGLTLRLVGANPRASIFSGIDNRRVVVVTHTIAGLLASLAGLITLARTDSANAQYGSSYILLAILIAVLGGVSIFGGKGRIGGILLALVLIQFLSSGFNMLLAGTTGGNFFKDIVWGILLLTVLTATTLVTAHTMKTKKKAVDPPGDVRTPVGEIADGGSPTRVKSPPL